MLNSDRPLQETLDFIIGQACRLMQCDASSLERFEAPGGWLRVQASCGLDPSYASTIRMPPGRGGAGRALEGRRPLLIRDAVAMLERWKANPVPDFAKEAAELGRLIAQGFRAVLSVPLVVQGEDYGAITLYYREPRRFGDEEVQLAASIGGQAALAIENARLREKAGEAAAFSERNRLARDLHDSVTQSLYSVTLYAEAAGRLLHSGNTPDAADHLRELGDTAREALREMRLLIFELSPPALESGSLAEAIQKRLDAVEERGGMSVRERVQRICGSLAVDSVPGKGTQVRVTVPTP